MKNKRPKNADEQKATVKETWASIPPQQCHKLITSMPRQIEAVITQKEPLPSIEYRHVHTGIKGGLNTCPFFWGVFFNEYMYICVRVCFCLCTAFPVKQIKKSKYQVGSGNETLSSSDALLSPLRVPAQARAAHQCSTHWSAHAHHRHAEVKPSLPLQLCLSWCGGEWW